VLGSPWFDAGRQFVDRYATCTECGRPIRRVERRTVPGPEDYVSAPEAVGAGVLGEGPWLLDSTRGGKS